MNTNDKKNTNTTFKSGDLSFAHRCKKRRGIDETISLETEKSNAYYAAILMKEVITKFHNTSFDLEKMKDYVEEALKDENLLFDFPTQVTKKEFVEEFCFYLKRYIVGEESFKKRFSYDVFAGEKTLNCFGLDVLVKPDCIFFGENSVTVVKWKYKKPSISRISSVEDGGANNSLELYTMLRYARGVAKEMGLRGDVEIRAGYVFLKAKKDNFKTFKEDGERCVSKVYSERDQFYYIDERIASFDNNPSIISAQVWDSIFAVKFKSFIDGSDCKNSDKCDSCSIKNACLFVELPERVKKNKKHSMKNLILNKTQTQIKDFELGVGRVNAVPGSGKTASLSVRGAKLIPVSNCLVITFTDAGAKELKARISDFIEENGLQLPEEKLENITTFNAFCYNQIKNKYSFLNFPSELKVVDEIKSFMVVEKIINEKPQIEGLEYVNPKMNLFKAQGVIPLMKGLFDIIKKKDFVFCDNDAEELVSLSNVKITKDTALKALEYFKFYEDEMRKLSQITYDDQEKLFEQLCEINPSVIEDLGFEHIMIDEAQDTSPRQMRIVKRLCTSSKFKSLLFMGDDSQAIFSFRDTSPENLINLFEILNEPEQNFVPRFFNSSEMFDFYLTDNYRSTHNIAEIANRINEINQNKIDKKMVAHAENVCDQKVVSFNDSEKETSFILEQIKNELQNGKKPSEIAIIAPTRKNLLSLQKKLQSENIPSIMLNPDYISENAKVKALIDLSRTFLNVDFTANYIGFLNVKLDGKIFDLDSKDFEEKIEKMKGIINIIKSSKSDSAKKDLFKNLAESIANNDELYENFIERVFKEKTLEDINIYLKAFSDYGKFETFKKIDEYANCVSLVTVHSSKGLEWDTVFVSLTDFYKAPLNFSDEEEKRRLLYVAVTRAMKKLVVTGTEVAYKKTVLDQGKKVSVNVSNMFLDNAKNAILQTNASSQHDNN